MSSAPIERHVRWPPERFYWAVLDASILPKPGRIRPQQLGFLLEPLVPQPLEELHAIFEALPDRRYLACALDRARLEAGLGPSVESLTPSALPPFVRDGIEAERLNLLTGPFTPEVVRRVERRRVHAAVLVGLALVLSISAGLDRRASAAGRAEARAGAREERLYREILGPSAAGAALPLPLLLESELRSLRQTRAAGVDVSAPADAARVLGELLGAWPKSLPVETDSIRVTPESIHVQGSLPTSGQAQELATAVSVLEGWVLRHPTIRAQASSVRATIQLTREEAPR